MDDELYLAVSELSKAKDISQSKMVATAILFYLDKNRESLPNAAKFYFDKYERKKEVA